MNNEVVLHNWLVKSEKEYRFPAADADTLELAALYDTLEKTIEKNGFSLKAQMQDVRWEETGERSRCILLKSLKKDEAGLDAPLFAAVDTVQKDGFFCVRERILFTAPVLPDVPRERIKIEAPKFNSGIFIAGIIFLIVPSLIYLVYYRKKKKKHLALLEYNAKVKSEVKTWHRAWEKWEQDVFLRAFLPEEVSAEEELSGAVSLALHSLTEGLKLHAVSPVTMVNTEQQMQKEFHLRKHAYD